MNIEKTKTKNLICMLYSFTRLACQLREKGERSGRGEKGQHHPFLLFHITGGPPPQLNNVGSLTIVQKRRLRSCEER
ncbi:hypothetical protein PRUPE_3G148100 [Prunus persica]|uniref:Uncharacterized protein n=1 Tax=Prunus persica TaxID=3760 RepID=A0A251Q0I4_PRUPE|nr:hypothetical protein PRUPE_3G148100 [Prunus persica]